MSFPVLICDDSTLARKLVQKSLPDGLASEILTACHGQEALDLLLDQHIPLLLLDLTMPVLDGVAVLEEIKRKAIETFVVVISGDIQPQMKQRVIELGALDFVEKPVDKARLTETLRKFGIY